MLLIKKTLNQKSYDKFSSSAPEFMGGNFLQSFEWGEFQKICGHKIQRIVIKKNQQVIGRATFIIKKISPLLSYAYCPFGPLLDVTNLNDQKITEIYQKIADYLKNYSVTFWRFNPPLLKDNPLNVSSLEVSAAKTVEPAQTTYINLNQKPEILLKKMKQKTRYNIRLAQKKNLILEQGHSLKNIRNFLKLLEETSQRDGFSPHKESYYKKMITLLGSKGLLKIYSANYKNKPIAANIVIFYQNTATYLHGASSNQYRNLMAPHLLQWQTILDAKKQGCTYYDFWGIDEKKWPGVTRFKLGFQGNTVKFHPTYELPIKNLRFKLYKTLRKIYC